MNTPQHIAQQNRRLGDALGLVPGTTKPKFQWVHSSDSCYYFRESVADAFQKITWADRIGGAWMLCQWRPPLLSKAQWAARGASRMTQHESGLMVPTQQPSLGDNFPYPENGEYYGQPETALPFGMEPTDEITGEYIHHILGQLSMTVAEHNAVIDAEVALKEKQKKQEFDDATADMYPAFGNFAAGTKDGSVSFGGI